MRVYRIQQISEHHCGPAVIQMLLNAIGIYSTQEDITRCANAEHTIDEHGTRIDQLATATANIAPQVTFWYKFHSDLDDIRYLLQRGYGVGVEWQGLFYESEEEEEEDRDEDSDFGHYSIVTYIDEERQVVIIVDPYKDFADQDRIFEIPTFMRRWWDKNDIIDPFTGQKTIIRDEQLLFFIAPANETFPPEFGFKRADQEHPVHHFQVT